MFFVVLFSDVVRKGIELHGGGAESGTSLLIPNNTASLKLDIN
jgi:hypothetical protein